MRRLPSLLLLLAAALGSAGCVYRPNIQQGNLLEAEDVDQVTVGMTRSQVRYVLGTPMVSDPFHPDRWDYVYSLKVGRTRKADTAHLVVHFADDKVSRVERLEAPRPKPAPKTSGEQKKDGAEPPPAPSEPPSEPPPQPDASRPGGG